MIDHLRTHPHADAARDGRPAHASPAGAPTGLGGLRLLSVNHRTASLETLERFALDPAGAAALSRELGARGIEAVTVATCGRTELYWFGRESGADAAAVEALRARATPANGHSAPGELLLPEPVAGEPVARHLFRLACGLESAMLGEGEIVGQLREALERSGAGDFLGGVFRAALRCGGRARAETGIGTGALSVASAAVQLLAAGGPLARQSVLVVGTGDPGLKAARHLHTDGVGHLALANRTRERAEEAAAGLGAEVVALERLPEAIARADAVVVAAQAPGFLVTEAMVRAALAGRPERPLALVDVSMPRAVEPAAGQVSGAVLHDLGHLEEAVQANHEQRRGEVPKVEELIEHELRWLHVWSHQQMIRPLFAEMRRRIEGIRRDEIERARAEGAADVEALDRLSARLVDRLLSVPAALLRNGDFKLDGEHLRYLGTLLAPPAPPETPR